MKKIIMLFLFMAISVTAFAGGLKPAGDTWPTCINKPYDQCKQFGNPWVPNLADNPYQAEKWQACAKPIWHECNARFGKKDWWQS